MLICDGRIPRPQIQLSDIRTHHHGRDGPLPADVAVVRHEDRRRREQPVVARDVVRGRDAAWQNRLQPSPRGVLGEDVDLVVLGEVRVQEVVGVHQLLAFEEAALWPESFEADHRPCPQIMKDRELASGSSPKISTAWIDAVGGVQHVPNRQVRRHPRRPVAAEHEVQADREAGVVDPEVAQQPAETEHERAMPWSGRPPGRRFDRRGSRSGRRSGPAPAGRSTEA